MSLLKLQKKPSRPKNFLSITQQQIEQIQRKNIQFILSNSQNSRKILEIANTRISYPEWKDVFGKMYLKMVGSKECKRKQTKMYQMNSLLQSLCLINNRKEDMLKQISFLGFPDLKKLDLDGNKITNIEAIGHMHLPSLRQLFLYRNNISSFKPLSKCQLGELSFISIYDNYQKNFKQFHRMRNNITRIWTQGQTFRVQSQDATVLIKLQNQRQNKLSNLGINSKKRIMQPKIYEAFKRKNKFMTVYLKKYEQPSSQDEDN